MPSAATRELLRLPAFMFLLPCCRLFTVPVQALTCMQVSFEFLEYAVLLKAARAVLRKAARVQALPKNGPTTGFVATMAAISLCNEVNLYGFQMCDRSIQNYGPDGDFSKLVANLTTGKTVDANAVTVNGRNDSHYYCSYHNLQHQSVHVPDHLIELEHAMLRELQACMFLKLHS